MARKDRINERPIGITCPCVSQTPKSNPESDLILFAQARSSQTLAHTFIAFFLAIEIMVFHMYVFSLSGFVKLTF